MCKDQVPSTKFTIPLSGYGGRCDLKIDNLEVLPKEDGKLHPSYIAHALSSEDDQMLTVKFTVKNNSSRHAFVKTVLYSDRECIIPHSASNGPSPSHFVLPKQSSRVVQVSLAKVQLQRTGYTRDGKELIGSLCLWYGEEIARYLLKNALGKFGPSAITKCLSESNPLRNVAFDGIFEGESSIDVEEELEQVKPQFGDIQVFYSSIKKSIVEIFGPRSQKHLEMVEPGKTLSTLDRSKVASSHMHYKRPSKLETKGNIWEISPEHVILSVPNLSDSTGPSKIKIINKSKNPLKFDAAWSRNYLTITPHCGHVDPESVLIILLNANPSLATRRDELPWIGTVQISTQSGRDTKQLHVQIRDDIAALDASVHPTLSSPHHQLKARYSEPLTLDSFSTPMAISGNSRISEPVKNVHTNKIMLPSTVLEFGPVLVRSSSKSHLEFTNVCSSTIRWILTSFAPAYVKSVESTGDLYRTTYAAFIFSHTSGLLETGVKVRIPVTFSPVSEGQYSQFWDLEHHDASDSAAVSLNKVRIQVAGQGIPSSKGPQNTTISTKGKETHGIYVSESQVRFPATPVNESAVIKIPVKNRSKESHNAKFVNVRPPFHITHQRHTIRPMSYACLPVTFKPTYKGEFESTLVIHAEGIDEVSVTLFGRGV